MEDLCKPHPLAYGHHRGPNPRLMFKPVLEKSFYTFEHRRGNKSSEGTPIFLTINLELESET